MRLFNDFFLSRLPVWVFILDEEDHTESCD